MKMSTYIAIIAIGLLLTVFAHADAPGYPGPEYRYPQPAPLNCPAGPNCLPAPVEQYPPDQTIYCPPGAQRFAPPVLPYPGPQPRVYVTPRPFGGVCTVAPAGFGLYVVVLNNVQVLYGPAVGPNIQATLLHYQRIGVCRPY